MCIRQAKVERNLFCAKCQRAFIFADFTCLQVSHFGLETTYYLNSLPITYMTQEVKANVRSKISDFREKYPALPPRSHAIKNNDELRLLTPNEGLECFDVNLGATAKKGSLPTTYPTENPYLWVIGKEAIPAAIETLAIGQQLKSKIIKHTNLTGGANAHCGGEVWFIDDKTIVISGSSGRYGPDAHDGQKLAAAAEVFKEQGYKVAHLGMDETGRPAMLLVGEPQWI